MIHYTYYFIYLLYHTNQSFKHYVTFEIWVTNHSIYESMTFSLNYIICKYDKMNSKRQTCKQYENKNVLIDKVPNSIRKSKYGN